MVDHVEDERCSIPYSSSGRHERFINVIYSQIKLDYVNFSQHRDEER
jgi:hypothetical protein